MSLFRKKQIWLRSLLLEIYYPTLEHSEIICFFRKAVKLLFSSSRLGSSAHQILRGFSYIAGCTQ
jgi:hypothetical protein